MDAEYDFPKDYEFHSRTDGAQLGVLSVEAKEAHDGPKCGWRWFADCQEHDSCQAWQAVRVRVEALLCLTAQERPRRIQDGDA